MGRVGQHLGHGRLGQRLSPQVDRRRDPQPAPEQQVLPRLGRGAELPGVLRIVEDEPLDLLDEIGRRVALVGGPVAQAQRLGRGGGRLGRRHRSLDSHLIQHLFAAGDGQIGMQEGIGGDRSMNDAG